MTALLVAAFLGHFIADFLMQSRDMGKRKSEVPAVLAAHLAIQFVVVFAAVLTVLSFWNAVAFSAANAAVHGVIDWNIWKSYKAFAVYRIKRDLAKWQLFKENKSAKYPSSHWDFQTGTWKYWDDHWFYVVIGADQLLHGLTLILLAGHFT